MFLSLCGVIGKPQHLVADCIAQYTTMRGGGLQQQTLTSNDDCFCVIEEANGNTTVFFPFEFLDWDDAAAYLSTELNAPVFSFHIHDGDLWMYTLYVSGKVADRFNPLPDYWEEDISKEEFLAWRGDANVIAKYIPGIAAADVECYLVRWNLEDDADIKAYPDDEFTQEDWQMIDFMRKIGLPYPLNDVGQTGTTYKFWIKNAASAEADSHTKSGKSKWWKFW